MGRDKVRLGRDKPDEKGQARGEGTSQMGKDKVRLGRDKVRLGRDKPDVKGQARGEGTSQMGKDKPDGNGQGQMGRVMVR